MTTLAQQAKILELGQTLGLAPEEDETIEVFTMRCLAAAKPTKPSLLSGKTLWIVRGALIALALTTGVTII